MEDYVTKLEALAKNHSFAEKVTNANSAAEILTILADYDIHMTEEELKTFLNQTVISYENSELDEEMLDNVSGGGKFWDWVKSSFKKWFQRQSEKNAKELDKIISSL